MKYDGFVEIVGEDAYWFIFLSAATSKDAEVYKYNTICYILVEPREDGDFTGVATDGHTLHIVDPLPDVIVEEHGIVEGSYLTLKSEPGRICLAHCAEKLSFPNWKAVVPRSDPKFKTTFQGFSRDFTDRTQMGSRSYLELSMSFPEKTLIDMKYLTALSLDLTWEVSWYGPDKPVAFRCGEHTAVIMTCAW